MVAGDFESPTRVGGEWSAASLMERLGGFATRFNARFEELLRPPDDAPSELVEAVHYAALAPGSKTPSAPLVPLSS